MIRITHRGNFKNTERFLSVDMREKYQRLLDKYGQDGVSALASSTPKDTGETAGSWSYITEVTSRYAKLTWTNTNIVDGVPVVIMLQYGHATGSGYIVGRDFINPAIRPIFDKIAESLWAEVKKA